DSGSFAHRSPADPQRVCPRAMIVAWVPRLAPRPLAGHSLLSLSVPSWRENPTWHAVGQALCGVASPLPASDGERCPVVPGDQEQVAVHPPDERTRRTGRPHFPPGNDVGSGVVLHYTSSRPWPEEQQDHLLRSLLAVVDQDRRLASGQVVQARLVDEGLLVA